MGMPMNGEQMRKKIIQNEDGFALLFAMLALLLLASIGLAMVYAADTETSIDSNYKDQTHAQYAAYSALEEATDRIRQGCGTSSTCTAVPWPTDIPTAAGANSNIIYIINPKVGEVVSPWDPTNKFTDWEICDTNNENMPNNFCSNRPTASSKYTVYCNGASADCGNSATAYNLLTSTVNAPWKRAVPLDYKWIRINLKSEQMLPNYPVNSTTTTNGVVCWDGHGELSPGTGYSANCSPNGGLTISLNTAGAGWTGTPTVTLGAPDIGGGVQATTTVNTSQIPNAITTAIIDTHGSGYTTTPSVTLSGGTPTTAGAISAHVIPTGAAIQSMALASGGSGTATSPCWQSTPSTSITQAGGTGATFTPNMTAQTCIARANVTGNCNGANYKSKTFTGETVTGGGGTGFTMTLVFDASGSVTSTTPTAGGQNYTSSSVGISTGGSIDNGCKNNLTISVQLGTQLSSVTLGAGGAGYTGNVTTPATCTSSCPTANFTTPSVGTSPTASFVVGTPVLNAGQVDSLTITSAGSGYTSAPILTFGGPGTGATGHTTISSNPVAVNSITASGGSGYSVVPSCSITGGGLVGSYNCFDGSANGMTLNIAAGQSIYYGQVAQITAYAKTPTLSVRQGAEYTSQMELATSVRHPAKFNVGGAITLAGPSIYYNPPNSLPYVVNGADAGTCGSGAAKPAIGVIDDPANPQGLAAAVIGDIPSGREGNYTGAGAAPDVENAFSALGGSPTPATLDALLSVLRAETQPANYYGAQTCPLQSFSGLNNLNPTGNPPINFVDGNLTLAGNTTGSGILVVTGTLIFQGDYHWNGLVLVIGQGVADMQGGGNGVIIGSLYVAKIYDTNCQMLDTLGQSSLSNSGGGGNGVQYNSCYVDSYLGALPKIAADPSALPAKVLSVRTVTRQ